MFIKEVDKRKKERNFETNNDLILSPKENAF